MGRLAENLYEDASYREATNDFYFDRNPAAFADILEYYRSGELHLDQASCGAIFKRVRTSTLLSVSGFGIIVKKPSITAALVKFK